MTLTSVSELGADSTESQPKPRREAALPVKGVLEALGAVAGASALLSALLLYFGWVRTRTLYDYFGVPIGILNYGTSDFVLRSAEVFFRPVIWSTLTLAGLAAVMFGAAYLERSTAKWWLQLLLRVAIAACAGVCVLVGSLGLVGVVDPWWAALAMCIGGVLIVMQFAYYHRATDLRLPVIVFAVGLTLTIAAMFWAVSIYAAYIGNSIARQIAEGTVPRPAAAVYSKTDLGLQGAQQPNATEQAAKRSWPFTYRGYKVLAYANNRWFLIPQQWQVDSPTIILTDNDSVRVEVASSYSELWSTRTAPAG